MSRGAIAHIDLAAIAHNLHIIKNITGNLPIIAVVKADAYGHGAVEVSKKLVTEGISCLAVAFSDEAVELRKAGIQTPILVLFEKEKIEDFFYYELVPVVSDVRTADSLAHMARSRACEIAVHVKIDSGMGRLGLRGKNLLSDLIKISEKKGLRIEGLLSHFSEADLAEKSFACEQLETFKRITKELNQRLGRNVFSHIANSAALFALQDSYLHGTRPGLALYGYSPFRTEERQPGNMLRHNHTVNTKVKKLIPAMQIKTKILTIRSVPAETPISYGRTFRTKRKSRIAVIPVGYADGYSRLLSNKANVLVHGKRSPVVGRICMDLTMIDVTEIKSCRENDEVIIMGAQGNECITAYELAEKAGTIPYEILTSLGSRSQRVYAEVY